MAYIPERFVQLQLAQPKPGRIRGHFWRGSILSADLSGFTALSKQLSILGRQGAEEISAILNQLFKELVEQVVACGGELLKFGGDSLLAFFDAERTNDNQAAEAAAHAALAMQQRMIAFTHVATPSGFVPLQLHIGIHSGEIFVAEVGDRSHIELIISGTEVGLVAEAEQLAHPGEVVVSAQTAALLPKAQLEARARAFFRIVALPDDSPSHALIPRDSFAGLTSPETMPLNEQAFQRIIERLENQLAALQPYLIRGIPRRFLWPSTSDVGEFRSVSVFFVNFYDVRQILAHVPDAQLGARLLNAYYRRVQQMVHHYDGIVNKVDISTNGNQLMALFGAPTMHEDDPMRAVRCALELEEVLTEANAEIKTLLAEYGLTPHHGQRLQHRVGVGSGSVFAGRVGGAQRYEYTVIGPAVNLSARLMDAASERMVLIAPSTRQAVEHQVLVVDHQPLVLKGISEAIIPSQAVQMQEPVYGRRSSYTISLKQSPLIGRDAQMALLLEASKAALNGIGRAIALVGEAGIGKTRMVAEVTRHLVRASMLPGSNARKTPQFSVISSGDCHSYEQNVPYIGIRLVLRSLLNSYAWLSLPSNAPTARITDHLSLEPAESMDGYDESVDQLAPHLARFAPLLADVLGVALHDTPLTQSLTAEQRHDRVQELVVALLIGAARKRPLIIQFDDLQWADASSLHIIGRLAQEASQVPLLLLMTYRPSPPIDEPWCLLPLTTRVVLDELSVEQSIDLLSGLLNHEPPADMFPLLERTQGNPFFVEELVRSLIASGTLAHHANGSWYLTRPLDQVVVPNSIEGLIMSRLDQLDDTCRMLLQIASIMGNRFDIELLASIADHPDLFEEHLQHLVLAQLIRADDEAERPTFYFQHALIHDVIYQGMLYAQRRELHHRVAQHMEQLFAHRLGEYMAPLATHYLMAEEWEQAFHYYYEAGIRAQQRYAHAEALQLFQQAIETSDRYPSLQEDRQYDTMLAPLPVYPTGDFFYRRLMSTSDVAIFM
ncbi:MAG: AAA family ATPase [Chloroflexaceae bacterium]|nr:AAA family ATPase [Chloroflexaceae bacterium]